MYNLGPSTGTMFMSFNLNTRKNDKGEFYLSPVKQRWFTNVNFRKAVDYAIDRENMIFNIANGIKKAVNEGEIFEPNKKYTADGCDNFTALFRERVNAKLTPFGKVILGEPSNLKIKFLQIRDNTDGAELLQKCEEVGSPTRWYNLQETRVKMPEFLCSFWIFNFRFQNWVNKESVFPQGRVPS